VRAPIINGYFPLNSWIWSLATTFVLLAIGIALQGRFRDRIAYWL
jgi:lipopolysaccharide transport system permease protein